MHPSATLHCSGGWTASSQPLITTYPRVGLLFAHETARIDVRAVFPHFQMNVHAGGAASGARLGDFITDTDQIADAAGQARIVCVARHITVAVVDFERIAVTGTRTGESHHAIGHRNHRVAMVSGVINALVELAAAAERVRAQAKGRGDVTAGHRHARRQRRAVTLAIE